MKIYRSRRYRAANHTTRRIIAYGIVTLIILVMMGVWGLTLLANLSNFWDSIHGSTQSAPTIDTSAPPPPVLAGLPSYTNVKKIDILGSAEPASTVTLTKDGQTVDTQLVGNDGQFGFRSIALKEGLNSFSATAKDAAGNVSGVSNVVSVALDSIPPKLTVNDPTDGLTVSSQYLTVDGTTDPKATVTVNGAQQIVHDDGSFSGIVTLNAGANTITVLSTDQAGNQTKVTRTVTYTPS